MSFSSSYSRNGTLKTSMHSVKDPKVEEPEICKTSEALCITTKDYGEELLTETCSSLSTTPDKNRKSLIDYENDDSDYSDYDTDDSFQEFKLKDWLKLVKAMVSKHETPENKDKLLGKYDELQDFFYFLAVEYFTGDQDTTELISMKRNEFVTMWQDVIGPCDVIFDLLVDLMNDINVENSFRI